MFKNLLIVNRGEIACRIIKTAKRLGITCFTLASDADKNALHTQMSDHTIRLYGNEALETYLDQDKIIDLAKKYSINAVHPGYGFLSENANFARACGDEGITFIGPDPKTIEDMGSKAQAKRIMQQSGIKTIPGYQGEDQTDSRLVTECQTIGFPVIIKPSAGGGGKGMRIVNSVDDIKQQLTAIRREAKNSFGDDHLILEKYITSPRHIEVQIFGDKHGNIVHLFERECSLQRRYQKIIEEAPCANLSDDIRNQIYATAIQAAKNVNYIGAGTVEFLYDESNNDFYFMEMNTRLQVEHPVTEMITSIDLVEWQTRIALGEKLPLYQADIHKTGHAIEARLYAENPSNEFLPSTGKISYLHFPAENQHCRIDHGIQAQDTISIYYDPMVAKIISYGSNRDEAINFIHTALNNSHIEGVKSNLNFLSNIVKNDAFKSNHIDTQFIDKNIEKLIASEANPEHIPLLFASFIHLYKNNTGKMPWQTNDSWRLNHNAEEVLSLIWQDKTYQIKITHHKNSYLIETPFGRSEISGHINQQEVILHLDSKETHHAHLINHTSPCFFVYDDKQFIFHLINFYENLELSGTETGDPVAPMPGKVIEVLVADGNSVNVGDPLMILEAMKMEHVIKADRNGVVKRIMFKINDLVQEGDILVHIDIAEAS
jgi:3-methylcrotonyl-CoA carboxylase alpha subunit